MFSLNSLLVTLTLTTATFSSPLSIPSISSVVSSSGSSGGDFLSDTQNGLSGACKPLTIIFARGSGETGNVGTATGPPFFQAVAKRVGAANVAVQGVEYGAAFLSVLSGGDAAGSAKMAQLAQQAFSQCPNTKVILSGYSQGGQLVHNAAKLMPADIAGKIAGAVTFGDPDNGQSFTNIPAANCKIYCNPFDNICQNGYLITAFHYSYSTQYVPSAADFVASKM
ncbi:cutinase [Diaporthe amygdali]|uniref:cutinase n=1 Tax=Phomopsis amygdali TaxID=1214568 RepID=UPI0022FF2A18|nr:cutinase [Diaporthe amygdali]KAJ0114202.1 cutinase [Diaporthe amygdali]